MSKYTTVTKNGLIIECGYDRPMDYVFVQVIENNDYLYSNLDDHEIDCFKQTDFTLFDEKLKSLSLEIPEDLKIKTLLDRTKYLENLESIPFQIIAGFNADLISEDDRKFGIEIGQYIPGYEWTDNIKEYEYFKTKSEALTRVNQINGAFIDDWDDLNE
jgi:hypothetical protein